MCIQPVESQGMFAILSIPTLLCPQCSGNMDNRKNPLKILCVPHRIRPDQKNNIGKNELTYISTVLRSSPFKILCKLHAHI